MLEIDDLSASIGDTPILRGVSLRIAPGEVHALMGPNGAGKSTLAHVLAGRGDYEVTGSVRFFGEDLLAMTPEERSAAGLFLSFQQPVEIPGITNLYFLRTALNAGRRARGEDEIGPVEFLGHIDAQLQLVAMERELLNRSVNDGFSGGEKKRNEILQLAVLEPRLAILDEIDSGLDIDALRVVADALVALRRPDRSFLVITHHERLLEAFAPDVVHVLEAGVITRSGGSEVASELEAHGYRVANAPIEAAPR